MNNHPPGDVYSSEADHAIELITEEHQVSIRPDENIKKVPGL
jgi:hypothetical protein